VRIAYSPDGKWLATAGGRLEPAGELKIWDPTQGTQVSSLIGHQHSIRGLAISPRGERLATISYDGTLRLWKLTDGPREEHVCRLDAYPADVVFSRDGAKVAVFSDDRRIRLFDTHTGRLELQFDCQCSRHTCMAFSPDDRQLATWSWGQPFIDLWDTRTGQRQERLPRPEDAPMESTAFESWLLAWLLHGPTLFTALLGEIDVWEATAGEVRRLAQPDTSWLGAMALSTNGKVLAVADSRGTIHLWDIENGTRLLAIAGQENPVTAVALNPDGGQIACGGHNRTVVLRNLGVRAVGELLQGR
jgi:WD40 repeat protein